MNDLARTVMFHPVFQLGVAPLCAALIVAGVGAPLRASGLAPAAGLLAAAYFMGGLSFELTTATRKIFFLAAGVSLLGVLIDLAFKMSRWTDMVLGVVFGLVSLWVFWGLVAGRVPIEAAAYASGGAVLVCVAVIAMLPLRADSVRAGAAALGMALGASLVAHFGSALMLGRYGFGLVAACAGFLILVMVLGPRVAAGSALALGVAVTSSLIAGVAVLQNRAPWYAVAMVVLAPLAVRLPVPRSASPAVQALVASLYALAVGAGAGFLTWSHRAAA